MFESIKQTVKRKEPLQKQDPAVEERAAAAGMAGCVKLYRVKQTDLPDGD